MSFISHFNVAFSHWVFSLGAENVTTAKTSGPTGEGLVFLTAVDSSAKLPCPWQGDWYVTLFWAPIKGVEAWCLPEEDLTVLIAIRLMRSFRVFLCIDFYFFFSPSPFTSLDVFLIYWCIPNLPADTAGEVPLPYRSLQHKWAKRAYLFECSWPQSILSGVSTLSCAGLTHPIVASNKTVPQFPLPYYVLWCHIEVSAVPSRAVIDIHLYRCYQWYMYAVSQQPLFF